MVLPGLMSLSMMVLPAELWVSIRGSPTPLADHQLTLSGRRVASLLRSVGLRVLAVSSNCAVRTSTFFLLTVMTLNCWMLARSMVHGRGLLAERAGAPQLPSPTYTVPPLVVTSKVLSPGRTARVTLLMCVSDSTTRFIE